MSNMQQMRDPSAGVAPQLLPHLHLISKQRYPQNNNPSVEMMVGWLLEAPKILNDLQQVQWQPLDCPTDGTIMLTWQPPDLGTNFASDGYIWHDQEVMFNSDVRGYNLQMYLQRAGFRPGSEAVATHSRRRYRLMPSQQNVGADPSIWLVHYSKGSQRDHIPVNSIQISPQTHALMQQRRVIFSQWTLPRKEFMLRDRVNWPTISAPGGLGRQGSAGQVSGAAHRRGTSGGMSEPTVEEEEDVSRGDALDFMTPRDVSRMRYEQNHELMEGVLESPHPTRSIVPPELGLGRKGELESLTKGFFTAPLTIQDGTDSHPARVGRMDIGKADEFTKLANQRIIDMEAELHKMKQVHQKRMEKLRKSSVLGNAEKRLRALHWDAGKSRTLSNGEGLSEAADGLDDIAGEVEEAVGKKIQPVRAVHMISKGGFQPDSSPQVSSAPESKQTGQTDGANEAPIQQQNAEAQSKVSAGISSGTPATPNPQEDQLSKAITGGHKPDEDGLNIGNHQDVEMQGLDKMVEGETAPTGDAGDWVMVDDQDLNLGEIPSNIDGTPGSVALDVVDQNPVGTGLTSDAGTPVGISASSDVQIQQKPQILQQQENQSAGQTPLEAVDFDLGHEFDNTAGDALADFHVEDDLGLDTMDDSAFGDAFPPEE